jgi:hypothetical protein
VKLSDTKAETLSRYEHPLAKALLEYRKTSKLVGTYGPKLLEFVEDGRIYGSWWQNGAGTGRMACSKPNLQNLFGRDIPWVNFSELRKAEVRLRRKSLPRTPANRKERTAGAVTPRPDVNALLIRPGSPASPA